MIHLIPYRSINSLPLGSSMEDAKELFGDPQALDKNESGELQYYYDEFALVFHEATRKLQECVVYREAAVRIGEEVFSWSLPEMKALCRRDREPMEFYGSVVLFNVGVVMTGVEEDAESDRAIGIFSEDVWAPMRAEMKPFVIK